MLIADPVILIFRHEFDLHGDYTSAALASQGNESKRFAQVPSTISVEYELRALGAMPLSGGGNSFQAHQRNFNPNWICREVVAVGG